MRDAYSPVKGKCTWWREADVEDDRWDTRLKPGQRRVSCSCYVEGMGWTFREDELPVDCPESRRCRYYIRNY